MFFLIFALLPFINEPIQVDQIEVNHFHDAHANRVFTQAVIWEYQPVRHVRAWRIIGAGDTGPIRCYRTGRYRMEWGGGGESSRSRVWRPGPKLMSKLRTEPRGRFVNENH